MDFKLKQNNYKIIFILCIIILFIIFTSLYFKSNKANNNEGFANQTISPGIYNYTGSPDIWIVPPGVTEATFTVVGGKGGDVVYYDNAIQGTGGKGAIVTTKLTNLSGSLTICVGGNGEGSVHRTGTTGLSSVSQGGNGGTGNNWEVMVVQLHAY